jgi:preprotein translocase subunit SecA
MLTAIREDVTRTLALATFTMEQPPEMQEYELPSFITDHIDPLTTDDDTFDIDAGTGAILSRLPPLGIPKPDFPAGMNVAELSKISRNAPCPCGSGRKYKHCHGQLD